MLAALTAAGCVDLSQPSAWDAGASERAAPDVARAVDTFVADTVTADGAVPDPAQYNFETDKQSWRDLSGKNNQVVHSTARSFAGSGSVEITLTTQSATDYINIGDGEASLMAPPAGATVTFHFWFAADAPISAVQPFVLERPPSGSPFWISAFTRVSSLKPGAWNTILLRLPATLNRPLQIGIEWRTSVAWTGQVYVDSVGW